MPARRPVSSLFRPTDQRKAVTNPVSCWFPHEKDSSVTTSATPRAKDQERKKYVFDVVIPPRKSNSGRKNRLILSSCLCKGCSPSRVAFSLGQAHHSIPFISSSPQAASDGNITVPDEYQHGLWRPGEFYEGLDHLTHTVQLRRRHAKSPEKTQKGLPKK